MRSARLLPFLLAASSCWAQTTWTVAAGGGGQFVDVGAAISAAAPGDRILVQGPGPYPAFVVDRGVDIEGGAGVTCAAIDVVGLPAGQRARVAGFAVAPNGGAVAVRQCAGEVVLASIAMSAATGFSMAPAKHGLLVLASDRVFVHDCSFFGYDGTGVRGGEGVLVDGGALAILRTSVTGGTGLPPFPFQGGPGADGVSVVNGGSVTVADSVLRGGAATSGTALGGYGGDGIEVVAGRAYVLGGSSLFGGPEGVGVVIGVSGYSSRGNVRSTVDTIRNGPVALQIGDRPRLAAAPVTPIGGNFVVGVQGAANQIVALGVDLAFDGLVLDEPIGVLHLTTTTSIFTVAALGAGGQASLAFPVPNTPAARHLDLVVQGATLVGSVLQLTAPTISRTQ